MSGSHLTYGRASWLKQGWPDVYNTLTHTLPRGFRLMMNPIATGHRHSCETTEPTIDVAADGSRQIVLVGQKFVGGSNYSHLHLRTLRKGSTDDNHT